MTRRTMVYVGRDRIQIGPWKSSTAVANLIPFPISESVPLSAVHKAVDEAAYLGYSAAYTAALAPAQARPFTMAGFELYEELFLLRRTIDRNIPVERGLTRRARRSDWDDVLALDALAFDGFWQFDRTALADAIRATPRHRFQVVKPVPVQGYHVTGLAGRNSYIQRVAVHPESQGQGFGAALVYDSLRWSWRSGAEFAQVNTQIANERAVALYERCGFELAPHRLHVLYRAFDTQSVPAPPNS